MASRADRDIDARDAEWVTRVRAGDYEAFDAMVREYGPPLCAYASTWVDGALEAEDLVQDLFYWVWEHRNTWSVPGSLRAYLYRAARNRAISHIRHRRVEQRFRDETTTQVARSGPPLHFSAADHGLNAGELSAIVDATIEGLPDRCRHVFILNRHHQLTYAQIATALQISVKTVEMHMGRALSRLRERLSDWL